MVWSGWSESGIFFFYGDDGRIAGQDHIWVQDALTVTVAMFKRVGLETNLEKMKSMVCTPGYFWGEQSEEAYNRRATGEGETFRDRNWTRVSFTECGVTVASSSMKRHMERPHGGSVTQTREVDVGGG